MCKLIAGCVLLISISANATAAAPVEFACVEERGGWCEGDGTCHQNYRPSANFRIKGTIPDELGQQQGVLRDCFEAECGPEWSVELRRGIGQEMSVKGPAETFLINLETGYFSHAMISQSATDGRVTFTFGHCLLTAPIS